MTQPPHSSKLSQKQLLQIERLLSQLVDLPQFTAHHTTGLPNQLLRWIGQKDDPGAQFRSDIMDMQQQRGRSPSVGASPDPRIRQSPSPQPFGDAASTGDLVGTTNNNYNTTNLAPPNGSGGQYLTSQYLNPQSPQPQFQQHVLPSNDYNNLKFDPINNGPGNGSAQLGAPSEQTFQNDLLNVNGDFNGFGQQQDNGAKAGQFDGNFILDPHLPGESQQQQEQSINPAALLSNMSSPQVMHPTVPGLMPPGPHSSEPTSPFSPHGQHWSPTHSRQNSLDPSSAFANGSQHDWQNMLNRSQFTTHRRAPSEYSDVSSSAAPSPYVAQSDTFDHYEPSRSPLMPPQPENQAFTDGLNIEGFNISDTSRSRTSPAHSPFVSPMMAPHPGPG